ncbi:MAG: hypothetical protein FWF44_11440, partial [Defluviitaleaceae bacterium]|nr:hypothetical protein [Defluviitaleaceae bacterium]
MSENTPLLRPLAGQHAIVPVGPDARLEFTFHQSEADLSKNGQDLVLSFDNGASLILQGFYDNFGANARPPALIVEGHELPGEAFLSALNEPALMPAAGAAGDMAEGRGSYEEALLQGVGGVDRLDKLDFDGWGRAAEVVEVTERSQGASEEQPGGTFGLEGNSYDMNGIFIASGMYEDWRPNQHEGDYETKLHGKLDFNFTPTGTTIVDAIHLSGFDAGAIIVIGTPRFDGDGNLLNGIPVTGPGQVFNFTQGNFDRDGVYVMPPKNSDRDMKIDVTLDLHAASSGVRGSISGTFTIVVDAVADKPTVQEAGFDDTGHVGQVDEARETRKEFDEQGRHIVEQRTDGTEQVTVAVPFHTTVKFADYEDGSEKHYVLIEVPSAPEGAVWTCPEASGTITGPDGKDFFQIPVDNQDIAAGKGEITVDVHLTVTGDSAAVTDTDMTLKVGAMAEEDPGDRELSLENNIAFDFKEGGADLHLDVVDGGLKITAGWASEGNNDAKHLGTTSDGYAYTGQEAGVTGNLADGATNTGAPIVLEAGVDSQGRPEVITSVTLVYDASEGHLFLNGADLDPDGTGRVTIDGLSTGRLEGLAYRPNEGSFSDNDVDIRYQVNVQNESGVKGSYSGSFIVVVDAVADLSAEVISNAQGDHSNQWYVDHAKETIKDASQHDAKGWETDSFKLDYSQVQFGFAVHVSTTFPDTDGSERHYVLVEHPSGWILGDLPPG